MCADSFILRKSWIECIDLYQTVVGQIASAVDYLHQRQVTHRDLKPENILLMTLERETVCKVTDFGLAKLASTMSSMTTFCGTPLFVAPEVIVAQGNSSYTAACDLWSLGVLLYLCLGAKMMSILFYF